MNIKTPSITELERRVAVLKESVSGLPLKRVGGQVATLEGALHEKLRRLDTLRVEAELLFRSNLPGLAGEERTIDLTVPGLLNEEVIPSIEAPADRIFEFSIEDLDALQEEQEVDSIASLEVVLSSSTSAGHSIEPHDRSGLAEEGVTEISLISDEVPAQDASLPPGPLSKEAPETVGEEQEEVDPSPVLDEVMALAQATPRRESLPPSPTYIALSEKDQGLSGLPWAQQDEIQWQGLSLTDDHREAGSAVVVGEDAALGERRAVQLRLDPEQESTAASPSIFSELEDSYEGLEEALSRFATGAEGGEDSVENLPESTSLDLEGPTLGEAPLDPQELESLIRGEAGLDEPALKISAGSQPAVSGEAAQAFGEPAIDLGAEAAQVVGEPSLAPAAVAASLTDEISLNEPQLDLRRSVNDERLGKEGALESSPLETPPNLQGELTAVGIPALLEEPDVKTPETEETSRSQRIGETLEEFSGSETLMLQSGLSGEGISLETIAHDLLKEERAREESESAAPSVVRTEDEDVPTTHELDRESSSDEAPPISDAERRALEEMQLELPEANAAAVGPQTLSYAELSAVAAEELETMKLSGEKQGASETGTAQGLDTEEIETHKLSANPTTGQTGQEEIGAQESAAVRGELRLLDFADFLAGEGDDDEEDFFNWTEELETSQLFTEGDDPFLERRERSILEQNEDPFSVPQQDSPVIRSASLRPKEPTPPSESTEQTTGLFKRLFGRK
ncbi:MAG: hypothetical protein VYD19_06975 [Myxococcota bacterium]|nr:hypothetical protein [Myxococcota bacterium]